MRPPPSRQASSGVLGRGRVGGGVGVVVKVRARARVRVRLGFRFGVANQPKVEVDRGRVGVDTDPGRVGLVILEDPPESERMLTKDGWGRGDELGGER